MLNSKLEDDIIKRIKQDFGKENVSKVEDYLNNKLDEKSDRIQRCILHLSQGSFEKLQHNIKCANTDYRDVIWWAE